MPTALERQIAQARSHQERALLRAHGAHDALLSEWPTDAVRDITLPGGRVLRVLDRPSLVRNPQNDVVGVEVDVELYRRNGQQLPIDGHRRIINVPLLCGGELAPAKAFLAAVVDSIRTAPAPEMFGRRGTVDTFFGDAADDGAYGQSGTYATARDTGTGLYGSTSTNVPMGQDNLFRCFQMFTRFDTSSLPDGDVITSAVPELYGFFDLSTTDFTINCKGGYAWANGTSVQVSDFRSGAQLAALTTHATFATSGFSTSGYNTFTESGLAAVVDKTGYTYLTFASSRQEGTGNAPTGNEVVYAYAGDQTGTTNDPKLTVTHVAPPAVPHQVTIVRQAVQRAAVR